MTEPPPYTDSGERSGMPRWAKLSLIIGLLLALLVVVLVVTGVIGEGHQPRRHGPSGGDGGTAPSSVVAPGGGHVRPPHG